MTLGTARCSRWRPWQFHLRTLLVLMMFTAIVAAVYGWRQRREDYLLQLVESFNAAIEDQHYEAADRVACEAVLQFPENNVATAMREKSRLVMAIVNGTPIGHGFVCGTGAWQGFELEERAPNTGSDEVDGCSSVPIGNLSQARRAGRQ